jgi:hypothetical protein
MTNNAAIDLGKNCPNLLFLDLNRCSVSEENISSFFL